MKSNYSIEKKEHYLLITVSGEFDKMEFLSYPKIIKDECEKEKLYSVLLNGLNVTKTNASTMDRFFIGEEIAKVLGSKIKLAVAWPEMDINKFAETVAINRGSNISVFGDIEKAKIWLLNKK